jgi:hypothetical protein
MILKKYFENISEKVNHANGMTTRQTVRGKQASFWVLFLWRKSSCLKVLPESFPELQEL